MQKEVIMICKQKYFKQINMNAVLNCTVLLRDVSFTQAYGREICT